MFGVEFKSVFASSQSVLSVVLSAELQKITSPICSGLTVVEGVCLGSCAIILSVVQFWSRSVGLS